MTVRGLISAAFVVLGAVACGHDSDDDVAGPGGGGTAATVGTGSPSSSTGSLSTSGTTVSSGASMTSGTGGGTGAPSAADLLALTQACNQASNGKYATDDGEAETVAICSLTGAYFWTADLDVDC